MNEHVDYRAKKANGLTKFFWWCAGADAEILKYSSYSDHVKYGGIGNIPKDITTALELIKVLKKRPKNDPPYGMYV